MTTSTSADHVRDNLLTALEAAVPLHIINLRNHTPEQRAAIGQRVALVVGSKGDVLQYGGGKRGAVAEVFNALALGLAAAAYQVGGVTFAGVHWCTDHAVCLGAEAEAATPGPTPKLAQTPRPIVDLELPA